MGEQPRSGEEAGVDNDNCEQARKRSQPDNEIDEREAEVKRTKENEPQGMKRDSPEGSGEAEEEAQPTKKRIDIDPGDTEITQALNQVDVAEV